MPTWCCLLSVSKHSHLTALSQSKSCVYRLSYYAMSLASVSIVTAFLGLSEGKSAISTSELSYRDLPTRTLSHGTRTSTSLTLLLTEESQGMRFYKRLSNIHPLSYTRLAKSFRYSPILTPTRLPVLRSLVHPSLSRYQPPRRRVAINPA